MVQKTPRGAALRFYEQSLLREEDGCVVWPFARNEAGYAVFGKQRGAVKSSLVSRVVCAEKNGPPPTEKHEAAHLCGRGHLGCINHRHLQWKTSKQNKLDQHLHGTKNSGERNGMSKLTADDVSAIRSSAYGRTQAEIAKDFGIDQSTVSCILRGKKWRHTL